MIDADAFVVDASVLVSYLYPQDIFHESSWNWLRRQVGENTPLIAPIILLTEVGGAIARRTGNSGLGRQAVEQIQQLTNFRLVPIDHRLGLLATELAVDLQLRGADAIYVAIAAQLDIPLVSWDDEQRGRASGTIQTHTP
jgi:predicted nucleic acid-binding protein